MFDFALIFESVPFLARGAVYTVEVSVLAIVCGLVLGWLLGLAAVSGLGPKAYYGAVVRKGDTALLEYVNGQIRKFKQDGTLKALQEKWLGESDVPTLPDPWTPLS